MTTHTLYRHYDARGALLYVGITGRGQARAGEHAVRASWWPRVALTLYAHFDTRDAALAAEAAAVSLELPEFNVIGAGGSTSVAAVALDDAAERLEGGAFSDLADATVAWLSARLARLEHEAAECRAALDQSLVADRVARRRARAAHVEHDYMEEARRILGGE